MRVYNLIRLQVCVGLVHGFGTTESKFVVYDVIGRNMFLELLVVVLSRVLQYFVMFIDSVFYSLLVYLISLVNTIR